MSKRSFVEAYVIARTTVGHQSISEIRQAIQDAEVAWAEIEKTFPLGPDFAEVEPAPAPKRGAK